MSGASAGARLSLCHPKLRAVKRCWGAQVALETRETAAASLGALQEQGQQVNRINRDLGEVCAFYTDTGRL